MPRQNFSIADAFNANVAPQEFANEAALLPGGSGHLDEATMLKYLGLKPDGTPALSGGSVWQPAGGGQLSVDSSILGSNMKDSVMDWLAPLLLLGAPLGGMIGGLAGGAGAGTGVLEEIAGLTGSGVPFGGSLGTGATAGAAGLQGILQQLQSIPGGAQVAQQLLNQMTSQGGGGAGGLGSLLPLLGIGSGLNTMFGSHSAVDPNMINQLWQAGQKTYSTSLDPQNVLHDRTQQQVVDASRAGQSARGIGMSPYGAGLENKAVSDFNIDWQNQALQRQLQGTQAFSGAGNTASQAGIANNAQAFLQNQTGLNNLTTGLGGLFGGGAQGAGNQLGQWLSSIFSPTQSAFPSQSTTPASSYDSSGTFTPYYTGEGAGTGPAYG